VILVPVVGALAISASWRATARSASGARHSRKPIEAILINGSPRRAEGRADQALVIRDLDRSAGHSAPRTDHHEALVSARRSAGRTLHRLL